MAMAKRCIFMDSDGICHGKYMGFRCIGKKCELYGKFMIDDADCAYLINGYCKKFRVFGCKYADDKTKCPYFKKYLEGDEKEILGKP